MVNAVVTEVVVVVVEDEESPFDTDELITNPETKWHLGILGMSLTFHQCSLSDTLRQIHSTERK